MPYKYNPLTGRQDYYADNSNTEARLDTLENTILRIHYYEDITSASGTITKPQNSTILLNQWSGGIDALVSEIVDDKPNFESRGIFVNSFNTSGAYSLSGSLPSATSALIYVIAISLLDYNLYIDKSKVIEQVQIANQFSSLKVGDIAGGNFFEVEEDGTHVSRGNATVFDDMLNNASSFAVEGDRIPPMKYFINNGLGGVDNARSFNGNSNFGTIPVAYTADWHSTGHISFNMWLKPDDLEGQILFLDGMLDLYFSGGNLIADWGDVNHTSSVTLSQNAWSMVTVTLEDLGTRVRAKMFINGVENKNTRRTGNLGAVIDDVLIARYTDTAWYNKSVYDELFVVNKTFSQENVDNLYNLGIPESLTPAILLTYGNTEQGAAIVEATDVLAYFQFNEQGGTVVDNSSTLGTGEDMILNEVVSIVSGIVGSTGSKGIAINHWPADRITEVHISAQTPHARKDLTNFLQHVHIMKTFDDTGWVCFALEYIALGLTQTLGNTTIIRGYIIKIGAGLFHQHSLTEMLDEIDGSQLGISSTFVARLYRDTEWEDANDGQLVDDGDGGTFTFEKYNHDAIIFASDAHVEIDSDGSREPYAK